MTGLRPRWRPLARLLTDALIVAALSLQWLTGEVTLWLHLAYIATAAYAFYPRRPAGVLLRSAIVSIVGGADLLRLHSAGVLASDDLLEIPLMTVLSLLFAAFALLRSRDEARIVADHVQLARQIDAIPFATIAYDGSAKTITWNAAAERLFGWHRDEVVGRPNPTLSPEMRAESANLHRRVLGGETLHNVEVTRRARGGRTLELALFTAPFEEGHPERGFLALYDDIGERKRLERERDDAQRSYRSLIEALPLVTYVDHVDDDATNIYTSPQVETLLGWTVDDLMQNPSGFGDLIHPDDRTRVMANVVRCNETRERFVDEYRVRHRGGHYVWVRDESTIDEYPGEEPLARGFLLDLTKRKALEEQLLQAQKMDALGQFAGGIAHDFNNLLTAIGGYADLAGASVPEGSSLARCLDGIRSAAAEAAGLTTSLLAFSRKDVSAPQALDLNGLVTDAASLLERLVRDDVTVRHCLAPELPAVAADPVQLKQVLVNLALNARDAMPGGGMLTLETAWADEGVVLRVRDEGCGMDDETRRRALEPFFTTKRAGEGTGLGLSVVYGIVQSLGGSLRIDSAPAAGTTVEVLLPVSERAVAESSPDSPRPPETCGGRVLVVEDREVVRRIARDALFAAGFSVEVAADGREALAVAEFSDFDVLVTDVVMPGMSGPTVAARLRSTRPDLPVLFMSGYTDDVLADADLAAPGTAFIRKPFQPAELARQVGALLEARPAMAG